MCTPRRFHPSAFKFSFGARSQGGELTAQAPRPAVGEPLSRNHGALQQASKVLVGGELPDKPEVGEAPAQGLTAPPPKARRRRKKIRSAPLTDHVAIEAIAVLSGGAEAGPAWKVRNEAQWAAEEAQSARAQAKVQARIQAQLEAGQCAAPRPKGPTRQLASPLASPTPVDANQAPQDAEAEAAKEAGRRLNPRHLEAARRLLAEAERKRAPGHAVLATLPATVVEVTVRIRAGQFLLRPDAELNSLVAGVLGRGQAFTGVCIGAVNVMSGHASWVVAVTSPEQLADFNNRVVGQLGDRVGRLRNMRMRIWGRRNRSIVVDATTTDICDRLKYCMANGTKEHLVTHPARWPGLNSARVFVLGERMLGKWTDFTALGRARRRDPDVSECDFQTEYEVIHSKMPGLDHLSDEDYRALMVCLCDEAAQEAKQVRHAEGLPEPGAPNRLTEVPFEHIPDHIARSPAPAIHAHDPARQRAFRAQLKQYREHLRAVRLGLTEHLEREGALLSGSGIPPTGWRPVDPAQLMPPIGIRLAPAISS